jgi:metal-responsive CopG/Arc/MetJ family transcriptional regulator
MAGRPKTGSNFVFRQIGFTLEQDQWLDKQAEKSGVSRSEIVRDAIANLIKELTQNIPNQNQESMAKEVTK